MADNVMSREELEEFTKVDLVRLANMRYGLAVNKNWPKAQLIDLYLDAQRKYAGNENITVLRKGEDGEVPVDHVKIVVQGGKYNPNNRPIFCAHNFKSFTVPVDKEIIMPAKYLSCLKDAMRREYHFDDELQDLVARDVHSYPFSILERGPTSE